MPAPAPARGYVTSSGAVGTSRTLHALKVAMLLLLLAAAGVGAGMAYTLGAPQPPHRPNPARHLRHARHAAPNPRRARVGAAQLPPAV